MYTTEQEFTCQKDALFDLSHGDDDTALQYVQWHDSQIAVLFRTIINDFESNYNRVPTSDELIWFVSEMLGFNIRLLY